MTLADLLATLETSGALHASRVKDMKTSLTLSGRTPSARPAWSSVPLTPPVGIPPPGRPHWRPTSTLETKGRTIGAVTRRNTRNNLRDHLSPGRGKRACSQHRSPRPSPQVAGRQDFERQQCGPPRPTGRPIVAREVRATTPCPRPSGPPISPRAGKITGRNAVYAFGRRRSRPYEKNMTLYLGYIAHIVGRLPTWNDWFDVEQLAAFVRWHGARLGRSVSAQGIVVVIVAAIANVIAHSQARAVANLRQTLKKPAPLHIKPSYGLAGRARGRSPRPASTEGRAPHTTDAHVPPPWGTEGHRLPTGGDAQALGADALAPTQPARNPVGPASLQGSWPLAAPLARRRSQN